MSRDRTGVGTRRRVRSGRSVCPDSVAEWSKAIDLKSIILWMRRFKSCHCRFFKNIFYIIILYLLYVLYYMSMYYLFLGYSIIEDNVAEWLRRLPAKQFPFGSVGSNPAVVVFY